MTAEREEALVLLAGEGANELGTPPHPGVLETLLRLVRPIGWRVAVVVPWKNIRKFRAGNHRSAEKRNVMGLALMASEKKLDVVVFARDADVREPEPSYAEAIAAARIEYPAIRIAGGRPKPTLEGWILAVSGDASTDELRKAKAIQLLEELGKHTAEYVALIDEHGLAHARNAPSLTAWLDDADAALAR